MRRLSLVGKHLAYPLTPKKELPDTLESWNRQRLRLTLNRPRSAMGAGLKVTPKSVEWLPAPTTVFRQRVLRQLAA